MKSILVSAVCLVNTLVYGGVSSDFSGTPVDLSQELPGHIESHHIVWTKGTPSSTSSSCFDIVQQAFDQWQSIPDTSLAFKYKGLSELDYPNNSQNIVTWSKTACPSEFVAITTGKGSFSIVFNDNVDWSSSAYLLTVALHEIGHAIGLRHSLDPNSLMYAGHLTPRSIGSPETKAVQTWYPLSSPPSNNLVALASLSVYSGQAPLLVSFTASGSTQGSTVSYAWDFGDGLNGSGFTATHSYVTNGIYEVVLTVSDSNGGSKCYYVGLVVGVDPDNIGGPMPQEPNNTVSPVVPSARVTNCQFKMIIDYKRKIVNGTFTFIFMGDISPAQIQSFSLGGLSVQPVKVKSKNAKVSFSIQDKSIVSVLNNWGDVKSVPVTLTYKDIVLSYDLAMTFKAKNSKRAVLTQR